MSVGAPPFGLILLKGGTHIAVIESHLRNPARMSHPRRQNHPDKYPFWHRFHYGTNNPCKIPDIFGNIPEDEH